jgi:hypothetical protein
MPWVPAKLLTDTAMDFQAMQEGMGKKGVIVAAKSIPLIGADVIQPLFNANV